MSFQNYQRGLYMNVFLKQNLLPLTSSMSMLFSSDRQREIFQLKQRRMKHILSFNLQEMQRKRQHKQEEDYSIKTNSQIMNQEALSSLMRENRRRQNQNQNQRNMLKACYERQIKERQEKNKMQKILDREYYQRQQEHQDYQESRRMLELAKIYNRGTYEAIPLDSRRRVQTQTNQRYNYNQEYRTNPIYDRRYKEPQTLDGKPVTSSADRVKQNWNHPEKEGIKDSLDKLNAEHIQYPRKSSAININH